MVHAGDGGQRADSRGLTGAAQMSELSPKDQSVRDQKEEKTRHHIAYGSTGSRVELDPLLNSQIGRRLRGILTEKRLYLRAGERAVVESEIIDDPSKDIATRSVAPDQERLVCLHE